MIILTPICREINRIYNAREFLRAGCSISRDVQINGRVKVYGKGSVEIGRFTRINSGEKYAPIGGQCKTIFTLRGGGRIKIGEYVGISNSTIAALSEVVIQDNVKIGSSCGIYDNDFHSLDYRMRISDKDTDIRCAPVLIMEGAFIGAHSIILKGVAVGRHSIVGAGSVVTKSIPDGELWAGNPARFIRKTEQL